MFRINQELLQQLQVEKDCLQAFRPPTQVTQTYSVTVQSIILIRKARLRIRGKTDQLFQDELGRLGSECPVCLESMWVSRITPCGHIFHSHCLRKCLKVNQSCPCCRATLDIPASHCG